MCTLYLVLLSISNVFLVKDYYAYFLSRQPNKIKRCAPLVHPSTIPITPKLPGVGFCFMPSLSRPRRRCRRRLLPKSSAKYEVHSICRPLMYVALQYKTRTTTFQNSSSSETEARCLTLGLPDNYNSSCVQVKCGVNQTNTAS